MKFLATISSAEMQANLPLYITYGPTNKASFELGIIDDALARRLPSHPDNAKLQLPVNLDWYTAFEQEAGNRATVSGSSGSKIGGEDKLERGEV